MSARIRVAVLGAEGRMGSEVCRAVEAAPDLELVARIDQGQSASDALAADAQVAVDFTHPDVVMGSLESLIGGGDPLRRRHHRLRRGPARDPGGLA